MVEKWTKAPWKVERVFNEPTVTGGDGVLVADCGILVSPEFGRRDNTVNTANARLIAAAPDLAAACQYIVDAAENGDEMKAVEMATTALAKARGTTA